MKTGYVSEATRIRPAGDTAYPRCRLEDCRKIIPETKQVDAVFCSQQCGRTYRRRKVGTGRPSGINWRSRSRA